MTAPLVTRFAPSPTGHLHVGGARSALFCWAYAKKHGGRFMIRIEDTDQARSSDESARGILDDLAWLGIDWDDGPRHVHHGRVIGGQARDVGSYFQAQRVAIYNAYIEHLMLSGRAYPAFETTEEIDVLRKAAVAAKQTFRYPRPADVIAGQAPATRMARAKAGERHVIRFVAPSTEVVVKDQVLGDVKFAAGEMDDFVIRKADGFPTYHFAVVIDDELMGTTHVLRAQEHLINTPRHVALQGALTRLKVDSDVGSGSAGVPFRVPVYGHMPLIFNMDGTKMSKRDKAKAARKACKDAMAKDPTVTALALASAIKLDPKLVADFIAAENDNVDVAAAVAKHFGVALPEIEVWDYRENGYLPESVTNFIALLGWSSGLKDEQGKDVERFDTAFLAERFDMDRIGKTNAKFDRVKLLSFNHERLQALSDEEYLARWKQWLDEFEPAIRGVFNDAQLALLVAALKPRARTFRESLAQLKLFSLADDAVVFDTKVVEKGLLKAGAGGDGSVGLRGIDALRDVRVWLAGMSEIGTAIHNELEAYAAGKGLAIGGVAQPVRIALSGNGVSPQIDVTLRVLGKARVLARIDACLKKFGAA